MGDDELAAIRNRRMAELQAQMVNFFDFILNIFSCCEMRGVFASSFLFTNTCPDIFPEVTLCAPNHSRPLIDKIDKKNPGTQIN
jgi:hypothetical protein